MPRTITAENVYHEIGKFRLPSDWKDECTLSEKTATPGIFYHGSSHVNISAFYAFMDRPSKPRTYGAFFTHNATGAAIHGGRSDGDRSPGGRIYRVELVTRNPFFANAREWIGKVGTTGEGRNVEAELCSDLRLRGFDAVVTLETEGTIFEIIVFEDKAIRRLDADIGPLHEWSSPGALETLLFYQSAGKIGPDYAPECVSLVRDCKRVEAADGPSHRVVVNAAKPIFVEQAAWPQMDFDILRYAEIDLLVDPRNGNALAIDPTKIVTINRNKLRDLRSKNKRRS